ncbi:hypothetical protein ACSBPU_12810 [Parapusillimonas sp. JC17]|uniref:hypothetical protein n=1 Tax=Parapusillimonas sp. JC17 TaxID=3445768 RepID=UPI003FA13021
MLKIVPPPPPMTPAEKLRESVKRRARPDGMIQCNRCGSRTIMTTVTGAFIKNGRKSGGTVTDKDVCYHCHQRGIFSQMLPELKRIK